MSTQEYPNLAELAKACGIFPQELIDELGESFALDIEDYIYATL